MKQWSSLLVVAAALTACAHQPAPTAGPGVASKCAPFAPAIAEINVAVRSLFDALAKDDEAAVAELTTPDFYAFEGERMSGPQLSAAIREAHKAGRTYIWNVGPIDVHVDCNMAWASWENVGASGIAPSLKPRRWLESAALVHDGRRWLLRFMHSTPVADRDRQP